MLVPAIITSIIGFLLSIDAKGTMTAMGRPLLAGTITGIALGNPTMGIITGAQLQLIFMGVSAVGASVPPNQVIGTVIATALVCTSGDKITPEVAMGLAVPVAVAAQSLTILARTLCTFLQHYADRLGQRGKISAMIRMNYSGLILTAISCFITCFPAIYFGSDAVTKMMEICPQWVLTGLSAAGGILPVVGFGLLLNMLSIKKLFPCFFIGFALATFGNFSMIGVTMVAISLAVMYDYFVGRKGSGPKSNATSNTGNSNESQDSSKTDDLDELMA